jgi:hypothetical protein
MFRNADVAEFERWQVDSSGPGRNHSFGETRAGPKQVGSGELASTPVDTRLFSGIGLTKYRLRPNDNCGRLSVS